jgi:hypothetical protein
MKLPGFFQGFRIVEIIAQTDATPGTQERKTPNADNKKR